MQNPTDKTNFIGYCLAWIECVAAHHHYEETEFFPNVYKAAGQKCPMDSAIHEHEAFYGGMDGMKKYLSEKGVDFSAADLLNIMDSVKEPLYSHLKAEPGAIVALANIALLPTQSIYWQLQVPQVSSSCYPVL